MEPNIEKKLISCELNTELDGCTIIFNEIVTCPPLEGQETGRTIIIPHQVHSPFKPHQDLIDSFKKLRKHALSMADMELPDNKKLPTYMVSKIKISGDMLLKQSRVVMTVSHFAKLTGKTIKFTIPQMTMYPKDEDKVKYHDADAMTAIIEDITEECWSHLRGKYATDDNGQLPLFERDGAYLETNFTK